jgi:hypothetical protein
MHLSFASVPIVNVTKKKTPLKYHKHALRFHADEMLHNEQGTTAWNDTSFADDQMDVQLEEKTVRASICEAINQATTTAGVREYRRLTLEALDLIELKGSCVVQQSHTNRVPLESLEDAQKLIDMMFDKITSDSKCDRRECNSMCDHDKPYESAYLKKSFQQVRSTLHHIASGIINKESNKDWIMFDEADKLLRDDRPLIKAGFRNGHFGCFRWGQQKKLLSDEDVEKWQEVWQCMVGSTTEDCHDRARIGATDPGERTFAMIYDAYHARLYRFGAGLGQYLDSTCMKKHRKCQSECDQLKSQSPQSMAERDERDKQVQRLRNQMHRLYKRKEAQIHSFHNTLARFIRGVFSVFILPKFQVGGMTRKHTRSSKKVSRRLRSLHHYAFRQRLFHVCKPTPRNPRGTRVILSNEAWTTKCCGKCAFVINGIGASKTVTCPSCHHREDRDGGAARKILIKAVFIYVHQPLDPTSDCVQFQTQPTLHVQQPSTSRDVQSLHHLAS